MPQPSDYEFVCKPYGGTTGNLTNRAVVYELRREGAESIIWTTTVTTTADKGENISYLIPHQEHGSYILSVYFETMLLVESVEPVSAMIISSTISARLLRHLSITFSSFLTIMQRLIVIITLLLPCRNLRHK